MSGLTREQIADNMGISRQTLNTWEKNYVDILNALKKGKQVTDFHVVNALYENALSGNVTAQIFWLKNRLPSEWRDKITNYHQVEQLDKVDQILERLENAD